MVILESVTPNKKNNKKYTLSINEMLIQAKKLLMNIMLDSIKE